MNRLQVIMALRVKCPNPGMSTRSQGKIMNFVEMENSNLRLASVFPL